MLQWLLTSRCNLFHLTQALHKRYYCPLEMWTCYSITQKHRWLGELTRKWVLPGRIVSSWIMADPEFRYFYCSYSYCLYQGLKLFRPESHVGSAAIMNLFGHLFFWRKKKINLNIKWKKKKPMVLLSIISSARKNMENDIFKQNLINFYIKNP